ncbi:MAG: Lipoprotein releasing system ATP-binding protein LolD [Labilithrix sp.]|nr:Lipoprotein releasing system ATP-binding protein LolD [Labilithrix sp.]
MSTDKKPLVVAKDVKKSFQHMGRTLEVLRGIDLVIDEGDMVGVVGQSGAGKSTFLHCIGTLDLVSTGSLSLDGEEVTTMSSARLAALRNRTIGFVFQFHHLLPEFNALENVVMPGMIQGRPAKEMDERAKALLEEVGLKDRMLHRPGELSGGEQQRVALARALVLEPKLLLADEPTGNLDSRTSEAMHQLFYKVNATRGTTIVIVTHNAALAAEMPRVVTLRDGRVEKDDRRDDARNYREQAPKTAELAGTGKVST